MGVKNLHPDYVAMYEKWDRCIVVACGQDAVHDAAERFIPRLSDQDNEEYKAYRERALFFNATWRTISGLLGMLFRKPPQVNVPDSVVTLLDDVTMDGTPMYLFALDVAEQCLKTGRVGVFVDYPMVNVVTATVADARDQNFRPLMRAYSALSIRNWKTRTYKNKTVLSMVVLHEMVAVPQDEFTDVEEERFRVLDLIDRIDPTTGVLDAVYRVREMKVVVENGKEVDVVLNETFPVINGQFLDYIPFQFIGVDDVNWEVDEPPLIDLVNTNISHYRVTADYEHGCHFTGLPTPVISGYTAEKEGEKFCIGSMIAWVFPNHAAKASYLEFTGQGLSCLRDNLTSKEHMMAVLGARMLEAQAKGGVESANTAAIHRGGENSMLASVAQSLSIGLEKCLEIFSKFAGADSTEVEYDLNRDFFPMPMDSLTLTAIVAAWQNQAISYETMFANLKKGEIVDTDADPDDEQSKITANPPPVLEVPTTPGDRAGNGPAKGAAKGTNSKKGTTSSNPTITQLQNSGAKK